MSKPVDYEAIKISVLKHFVDRAAKQGKPLAEMSCSMLHITSWLSSRVNYEAGHQRDLYYVPANIAQRKEAILQMVAEGTLETIPGPHPGNGTHYKLTDLGISRAAALGLMPQPMHHAQATLGAVTAAPEITAHLMTPAQQTARS